MGMPFARRSMSSALWRSAPRCSAPTGASRCRVASVSAGQCSSGDVQVGASAAGMPRMRRSSGHQRTLRTRPTANAPANADTAASTNTSTNEPVMTTAAAPISGAEGLRHRGRDVHDAEVLAARGRVGQHLRGERLVDREEAAVAEAEQPGGDHGDREVGHERQSERRDALQRRGDEHEHLAAPEPVGEPAADERGDDDEHHVDERRAR